MRISDDARVTPAQRPKSPARDPRFDAAVEAERRRAEGKDREAPRRGPGEVEESPRRTGKSGLGEAPDAAAHAPLPAVLPSTVSAAPDLALAAGRTHKTVPPADPGLAARALLQGPLMQKPVASQALAGAFTLAFPPNAWPLLRAEGTRGPNGLSLRLVADTRDAVRLRGAVSALRAELEASGERVASLSVETGGEW